MKGLHSVFVSLCIHNVCSISCSYIDQWSCHYHYRNVDWHKPAKVPVDSEIVSFIPHLQLGKYGGVMPERLTIWVISGAAATTIFKFRVNLSMNAWYWCCAQVSIPWTNTIVKGFETIPWAPSQNVLSHVAYMKNLQAFPIFYLHTANEQKLEVVKACYSTH